MRFIHVADVHLDSPLRGLERYPDAPKDAIRDASRQALENLVDYAVDERNRIDFVVIAGDLFDGDWKHFGTGLYFNKQMVRLERKGIRVFVLAGNHDAESRLTHTLSWPSNVRRFRSQSPQSFELDDLKVALHGQSYPQPAVNDDLTRQYPTARKGWFNIGVLHTCVDGSAGHEPYAPCTVEGLTAKNYDYWALGHVHKRWEVAKGQQGAPWIVFPGNLQGRDVGEVGKKGCTVVTVEDGVVSKVEHLPLDVVRWHMADVDLSGLSGKDAILQAIGSALEDKARDSDGRQAAVRIALIGRSEPGFDLWSDPEGLRAEIRAKAEQACSGQLWIEDVRIHVVPALDGSAIEQRTDALRDVLVRIRNLDSDPIALEGLAAAFRPLQNFLPRELQAGPDALDFTNPSVLSAMLADVEQILLCRVREG